MAEQISIPDHSLTKEQKYQSVIPQLEALVKGETDLIANLSNIVAALKQTMHFFWIGIYFVKNNELVLGPFQGPVACTRIAFGKGVCGTSWKEKKIINVPDVDKFPGHISCSSDSKSEIVLPALHNNEVFLVLDVDSSEHSNFDQIDEKYLNKVMQIIEQL